MHKQEQFRWFYNFASFPSPPDSSNGCTHAFTLPKTTWTRKRAVADERGRERGNEGKIKRKWTRDDEFGRYLLLSNVWWHESRGHRVVYFRVPLGLIWCVSLSSVYAYVSLCLRLANNCLLSLQLTVKAKIITPAAGEASFDGFSRLPDTAT